MLPGKKYIVEKIDLFAAFFQTFVMCCTQDRTICGQINKRAERHRMDKKLALRDYFREKFTLTHIQ